MGLEEGTQDASLLQDWRGFEETTQRGSIPSKDMQVVLQALTDTNGRMKALSVLWHMPDWSTQGKHGAQRLGDPSR